MTAEWERAAVVAEPNVPVDTPWEGLLAHVAAGRERLVLETSTGRRAVLIAESELARLEELALVGEQGAGEHHVVLTAREQEVLALVARGMAGAAVAQQLGLALNTVSQHLAAVRRKYGVRSSALAVARARHDGHLP